MVSLVKTNGHRIRQISEIGLSCVRHDAGMLSEIHAKTVQHCRAESCYLYGMICHRISLFIDKAISSFQRRLRSCVAAAGGLFEKFKYREGS